jgi:hypothetical protein
MSFKYGRHEKGDIPRMIVALPRAVPIPLPLIAFGPTRLNLYKSPFRNEMGSLE